MVDEQQKKEFYEILEEKKIKPVYQPIVSLETGKIYGYEALSRIGLKDCSFNTEEMFHIAEELSCVWKLEELCRRRSLKFAGEGKLNGKKLFVNVDPKVIRDEKFKEGATCKYLKKYGLKPSDIVFEVTERTSIEDADAFRHTIDHYRRQQYRIAIDDYGSEYAGVSRVCALEPHFLKIDMYVIRDIDKSAIRRSMVESIVIFCESANIHVIAEGIETKEELETLVQLGVHYGQGYYLQKPQPEISDIPNEIKEQIVEYRKLYTKEKMQKSFWSNVGSVCNEREITSPDTPGFKIYEYVKNDPEISEITVVDKEKNVQGVLTRSELMELFGGRYGYSLHAKKTASDLMSREFLAVDEGLSIEVVSKMAMVRPHIQLYNDVIVTRNDKYFGRVSVKELLETAVTIQVTKAADANPLTGLPGNAIIEEKIKKCLTENAPYAIAYIDLDNFKAYNDAYGFNNGDIMIKTVVTCMKEACNNEEFLGHIGGDDFVIIADYYELDEVCQKIANLFSQAICNLYRKEDLERGYIYSKNRNGFADTFPMATLSIAIITNKNAQYPNVESFSDVLVKAKKRAKQTEGNSIQVV